jgi:hypothetical protein
MIGGQFLLDRLDGAPLKTFAVNIAPGSDPRQILNLGLVQEVLRQRVACLERHAALAEKYQGCQQGQDDKTSFGRS